MRKLSAVALIFWILFPLTGFSQYPKSRQLDGCVRGGTAYAAASYISSMDVKKKYARRFDRLTKQPVQQLLCSSELQGLPLQSQDSLDKPTDHFIGQNYFEPLFINLATLDGLYGVRYYARKSARFSCGYFYTMVLIAGKHFYTMGEDTLANQRTITQLLSPGFSPEEIKRMQRGYCRDYYCSDYTFMPPEIIRQGTKLLFDLQTLR